MLVDDHEIFRNGLKMVINKLEYAEVTGEASNGREFLDIIKNDLPDIVFMDIQMPEMNGIEATMKAVQQYPEINIIVLSMFGEEEYLQKMINAGVKGFLLENVKRNDLDEAVQAIISGQNYFSKELLPFFTNRYFGKSTEYDDRVKLTKRELEILQLISQGLTDSEIGERLFISQRTVNGHRANLIAKTGSKNTVNLLTYAIKNNLVNLE